MIKELYLVLSPKASSEIKSSTSFIADQLGVEAKRINGVEIEKKSIDARKKDVKINVWLKVYIDESLPEKTFDYHYLNVTDKTPVLVVGAGPAGLFAALRLIELGFKPIVIERGKTVSERKRDLAKINRSHIVDPDSNYAFGEGGAGTFSDGKLYTRSKKRGNVRRVLDILTLHGADPEILVDTHPHIGTNKLPRIIQSIRQRIIESGGEVHFQHRVDDFIIENQQIIAVKANGKVFEGKAVVLATGHSARDIYYLLHDKSIQIEAKEFAMGVRVEHPQSLIDSIQYSCTIRDEYLPAASYSLVTQVENRGVYSFCMCPGGFIVPASTGPEEIVVNGMSPSKRDSKYANSGMVVQITQDDLKEYAAEGVLAGLKFQQELEHLAFINGGGGQIAPAQRLDDFINNKLSKNLPSTSYHPGIISSPLHFWLPDGIRERLQKGFLAFGRKLRGYIHHDAVIIGVESRTSSPVRIPRDKDLLNHQQITNLFPAGEGAGYAGGIVSAAVDGERVAEQIANLIR
ncbi:MAG: NAD(P)/FAD-dependent oxidoreductase [Bacteroidales bacterium]|nr:NAD(P)/FAD-dependent oxidoreductase [Bacteroidales bacterium]